VADLLAGLFMDALEHVSLTGCLELWIVTESI